ncbi:MAG TPA: MBG domain-containing protein, partial [Vicinamibacterales bacterium]|nr:MBG domain-containing protein [Vicinamibacterales bacterium]
TINKAALTITADSKTRLYGSAMPTMTASYSGFVNGETSAVLTAQPTLSTTATASSPFGTYPITVSGATAANYTITFVNGTLTVSRAPLTITADNKTRVYGAPMPALTASYSGLVNGETSAVLATQPTLSTTATASSPFGTYPITVSGATAANYTITFVNGTLTVGKANTSNTATATTATTFRFGATLTVKATIAAVAPGAGVPTGSVVFYDGAAALSGSVALASGVATFSTSTLPVGSHSITAVYAGDANFTASSSAPAVAITVQPDLTKTVTTVADFKAGTTGANTYVSQTGDGEVMLTPTFGTEFAGPNLPSGWLSTALYTGGDVSFGEGGIQLQGSQITSLNPLYGVGHTLEFAATFSGAPQQSAGLLLAQFTTKLNGGSMALYATTINGLVPVQTLIPGSNWFGVEHRFRVDWTTAGVAYWVDGVKVATHNVSFAPSVKMTIFANDLWKTDGVLMINWMRMTPYVTSGSYLSAVFNAGFQATWMNANWTANAPAGTTVAINYRTGNTPTPDGTWTAFKPLSASGAAMTGVSQYVQFQIAETTNNVGVTPSVSDVTIVYR